MKRVIGLLALLLAPTYLLAQDAGLKPLTADSFAAAKEAASAKEPPMNSPTVLRLRSSLFKGRPTPAMLAESKRMLAHLEASPYSFQVMSPYMRVVAIARESARKFEDPHFPALAVLNAEKIDFIVGPTSTMRLIDTIENVVIKRGEEVVRPIKTVVKPTVVQNAMGAKKETAEGHFTFDYAAFDPSTSITIVMIGKGGNYEWQMTPEELRQLK